MDMRYLAYCLADARFYDVADRDATRGDRFALAEAPAPTGWLSAEQHGWFHLHPEGAALPDQGWKLHVSATAADADQALGVTARYCFEHSIVFKFLPTRHGLLTGSMKYADRASSGKFITVYPQDELEMLRAASELDELLAGLDGPYILSDLRWGSGPVYVRYGGFSRLTSLDDRGESVLAIRDPAGALVPDDRGPAFAPPPWVRVPDALREQLAALGPATPPDDFAYEIHEALHFSNGGGIYRATHRPTGQAVVLKEARPHAGLDPAGRDAVTRLRVEEERLRELADLPFVVGLTDAFRLFEHHFLAEQFIDGRTLNKAMVATYPYIRADVDTSAVATYTDWALRIIQQVEEALDELHARGLLFGDLHPNNVMLTDDDRIVLIDFEMSSRIDDHAPIAMGAPGYAAPDGRAGIAGDRYALGCLKAAMFFPLTTLFSLDGFKIEHVARQIDAMFPVPTGFTASIRADLAWVRPAVVLETHAQSLELVERWSAGDDVELTDVIAAAGRAIIADATVERTDRLYPGDIAQHSENALGIAHGAAGVFLALHGAGVEVPASHIGWLVDRARTAGAFGPHHGLFDGRAGTALALAAVGECDVARSLMEQVLDLDLAELPSHLYGGLAGLGLAALQFGEMVGDDRFAEVAARAGALLADRVRELPSPGSGLDGRARSLTGRTGLMRGRAGHALLHTALHERSGDPSDLRAARAAIDEDLRHCVVSSEDGSLQVDDGWRVLPYLATGSTGIGMAIMALLAHDPDPGLRSTLGGIHRAAHARFVIGGGLFNGRAGLLEFLIRARECAVPLAGTDDLIRAHTRDLSWHAVGGEAGIRFVGDQLLRLSHDFATGTAGAVATLSRVRASPGVQAGLVPFVSMPAQQPVSL